MKYPVPKLILFDLDGTLMRRPEAKNPQDTYKSGIMRFLKAVESVYGVKNPVWDTEKFNGTVDKYIVWEMVKEHITRRVFNRHFNEVVEFMYKLLISESENNRTYLPIPEAVSLTQNISRSPHHTVGVLTGNVRKIAEWKVEYIGLTGVFKIGLYGDESVDRVKLARKVFRKSQTELKLKVKPHEVVVIGDTVNDINCGRAIGARTIGVLTGFVKNHTGMKAAGADLVVNRLSEESVYKFIGLNL